MNKEMIKITDKLQDALFTYKKGQSISEREKVFKVECAKYKKTLKSKQDLKDFDSWYKNTLNEFDIYNK